jgi:hypothetical protein
VSPYRQPGGEIDHAPLRGRFIRKPRESGTKRFGKWLDENVLEIIIGVFIFTLASAGVGIGYLIYDDTDYARNNRCTRYCSPDEVRECFYDTSLCGDHEGNEWWVIR